MLTWIFHKYCNVLTTHRDNDILLERALDIYVNVRLIFAYSVDCFMNFFDFLQWELEKFSLILRIFFIFSDNACIYDCSSFLSNQFRVLMLLFLPWNFNLLNSSLEGLEEMDGGNVDRAERLENLMGFDIRVFLGLLFNTLEFIFFVNWVEIFCC